MTVDRGVTYKKQSVYDCHTLDMVGLAKKIDFDRECSGNVTWNDPKGEQLGRIDFDIGPTKGLRLYYSIIKKPSEVVTNCDYSVVCEATPCHYGGQRWWFWCPSCSRRCRILYLPYGETMFACRKCHNLTYPNQQEYKSPLTRTFEAIFEYDSVHAKFSRTRSPKTKMKLTNKMMKMAWLVSAEGERLSKRKRMKRRSR